MSQMRAESGSRGPGAGRSGTRAGRFVPRGSGCAFLSGARGLLSGSLGEVPGELHGTCCQPLTLLRAICRTGVSRIRDRLCEPASPGRALVPWLAGPSAVIFQAAPVIVRIDCGSPHGFLRALATDRTGDRGPRSRSSCFRENHTFEHSGFPVSNLE